MKDKVGIGVIGTGFARKVQIPAFLKCEGAFIVSVASGSLENAQATAAACGAVHFTADWRETIAHPDVDLVCITTPPNLHREMVLFAVEHGKHILCEKPMAMNVAEAEEMTAAATKPILALIDHELRFQPGRLLAYKMLRDGAIGKIRHVRSTFQAPHRGDPNVPWNWWSDATVGGGALGAINSHIIDSLNWFLGCDIASVSCQLQSQIKERRDASGEMRAVTSDDEANMLLRFADGELTTDATGLVAVSMTQGPKYQNTMEFFGELGTLRVEHLGELFIAKRGESDWTAIETDLGTLLPGLPDTGFARAFMSFAPVIVDTIQNGRTEIEHAATFNDGVRVQKVLDAARLADREDRGVSIH
ncbi:MAG TPA: Gfo/Idh/MocA family oxidoreductase [Pyrinomonadaceae bacterium]|nr:Gfo/Idh/MocA family oxidoreductase [Pyrinomonadaceae bacterium]